MKAALGEEGTEQFAVSTYRDGKLVAIQRIHDPFVRTTITLGISRWDLFKGLFSRQYQTKVAVHVDGSHVVMSKIMQLNPEELKQENQQIFSGPNYIDCGMQNQGVLG